MPSFGGARSIILHICDPSLAPLNNHTSDNIVLIAMIKGQYYFKPSQSLMGYFSDVPVFLYQSFFGINHIFRRSGEQCFISHDSHMIRLVSQNKWPGSHISTCTHATFPCGLTAQSTLGHRRAEADSDKLGLFQLNSEPYLRRA